MKRLPEMKADQRIIVDKAYGMIFSMSDEEAIQLLDKMKYQLSRKSKMASVFLGKYKDTTE